MIPLVPTILGVALALVLSFGAGFKVRGDQERSKQLEVERGWHEKYRRGVAEAQMAAEAVGAKLRADVENRTSEIVRLRADLGAARSSGKVRLATCAPATAAAAPVLADAATSTPAAAQVDGGDRVLLTPDFRLRYDTALALVVPAGDRAGWTAAAGAAPGTADLWTVLDNATENAGRWAQCREMMTAAQQWFKQMGWVR